jgi:hypothetical protein
LGTFWLKIEQFWPFEESSIFSNGDHLGYRTAMTDTIFEIKKKSSLKLLSQSQPNFAEMILRWSPFKIVSVIAVLYPRWPPLLKIDISSKQDGADGHNFERGLPKDHFSKVWLRLAQLFQRRIFFFNFIPLFSNLHNRSKPAKFQSS